MNNTKLQQKIRKRLNLKHNSHYRTLGTTFHIAIGFSEFEYGKNPIDHSIDRVEQAKRKFVKKMDENIKWLKILKESDDV